MVIAAFDHLIDYFVSAGKVEWEFQQQVDSFG